MITAASSARDPELRERLRVATLAGVAARAAAKALAKPVTSIATSTQPSTYKRGDTAFEEGRVVSAPLNREAPSSRRSRREGR